MQIFAPQLETSLEGEQILVDHELFSPFLARSLCMPNSLYMCVVSTYSCKQTNMREADYANEL